MGVATDPVLELSDSWLAVDPGGQARTRLTVHHVAAVVTQFRVEVLGDAARWATVSPHLISFVPGEAQDVAVEVTFRPPPPPAAPAGEVPFGIRCVSLERAGGAGGQDVPAAVVEGDLVVTPVQGLDARLRPDGPGGARAGRFRVELQNVGTTPLEVSLEVADGAELLRFALAPRTMTVAAGSTATALLEVRPRAGHLLGKPVPHPFTVTYTEAGAAAVGELAGTFVQRAVVRKGWLVAAVLLVALVVLGWLWLRGQAAGTGLTAGDPPPVALTAVEAQPGQVRITWTRSAYATGYQVVEETETGVGTGVEPVESQDQTSFNWPDREPGMHCYTVAAVVEGEVGPATKAKCVEVPEGEATPAPTESEPPAAGGTPWEPQGWYAAYNTFALADPTSEAESQKLLAALQTAQVQGVRKADSRASTTVTDGPGDGGLILVYKDGFESEADALAECGAVRLVAPLCTAWPGVGATS